MDNNKELLELILTAEVLSLAKRIKADKAAKGVTTTSDCIQDAVREIKNKKDFVVSALTR